MTTAPQKLQAKGRRFWRDVTSKYTLRADELRLLEDACREIDLIQRLEDAMADAPLTVKGSMGQVVASPLITEVRQHRNVLASLLVKLKLPDSEEEPGAGEVVSQARAAAMARWGRRGA